MECLFCDFINKKRTSHGNGLPFLPIYEDKNILIFLTDTHNENQTHHLLVIPKKHIESIENIPLKLRNKLLEKVIDSTKILKKIYGGAHILLNDGELADQCIPHVHFHIIPKIIEKKNPWKNMGEAKFREITNKLKKEFK
ncbi:MAG: HIT family protein [archaeon]|nr:HIT family protein [archaeon]